ncbi:MAG TPA: radical SAM protein [Syntrophales bacterium]|nr:radical SAM protein [Syntrophales bacterium]
MLKVNEIFYSIQGESSYAGLPCVFVRLTGCNLRCSYCDTRYAYEEGKDLKIGEIIDRVMSYRCRLVEITGGEPLIQEETPDLTYRLLEKGFEVLLETNGSIDISTIDERCVKILDIKCPSSGQEEKNDLENLKRLSVKDEIKFVIGSREDYLYAQNIISLIRKKNLKLKPPLFSTLYNKMDSKLLAEWILADHLDVRLQIQLHKIIWGSETRGV